jgi:hypothetical protein
LHAPAKAVEQTPTATEHDRVREGQWQLRDHELSARGHPREQEGGDQGLLAQDLFLTSPGTANDASSIMTRDGVLLQQPR